MLYMCAGMPGFLAGTVQRQQWAEKSRLSSREGNGKQISGIAHCPGSASIGWKNRLAWAITRTSETINDGRLAGTRG